MEETKTPPFFFICVLITLFLAIFYNTVVNMAGIYVASELGGSSEISVYPMVFFGLGSALSIPLADPLADRFGPIKLIAFALLLYILFSIFCALAPTFFIFNVYRFGLGYAAGFFYILCRRLLLSFCPKEKMGTYSFIVVLMFAAVPVLGACFGAWLAYETHWRWIFHFNEPVALFIAAYFWIYYRHTDPKAEYRPLTDKTGYLFFFLGIGSLVTAAAMAQELDWYRSTVFLTLATAGIVSLAFFILWELNHDTPLLELKLLKSPLLCYALINLAILFSAYFGMIILVTLWLNIYVNYTPTWIAVLIGIMAVSGMIAFIIGKTFLHKFDPRFTLGLSILCFAASCYYSTYFDVEIDFFHLAIARSLSGLGLVLFLFPVFDLSFASHGPEKSSNIFTLLQVVRSIFTSLGAGLYVILWQRRQAFFHERLGEGLTINAPLTTGYFHRATHRFDLSTGQATEQLNVYLDQQSTSLGLNDAFGCMGYILMGLFALLILSFALEKFSGKKWIAKT